MVLERIHSLGLNVARYTRLTQQAGRDDRQMSVRRHWWRSACHNTHLQTEQRQTKTHYLDGNAPVNNKFHEILILSQTDAMSDALGPTEAHAIHDGFPSVAFSAVKGAIQALATYNIEGILSAVSATDQGEE